MYNYTITTAKMAKHIAEPHSTYNDNKLSKTEAYERFEWACNRYGLDNQQKNEDGTATAGGIGYEYKIEVTIE